MRWPCQVVGLLVLAAAALVCAEPEARTGGELEVAAAAEGGQKLPPLFDFSSYKSTFNKRYSSLVEELARRALFIPRALRVVASGIGYMYRRQNYHLAVNHMSDLTPTEFESMENRQLLTGSPHQKISLPVEEEEEEEQGEVSVRASVSDSELRRELNSLEQEMPALAAVLHERARERRRRRAASQLEAAQPAGEQGALPLRKLDMSALINDGRGAKLPTDTQVVDRVPSNNPDYQPLEVESQGLADQVANVNWYELSIAKAPEMTKEWLFTRQRNKLRAMIETDLRSDGAAGAHAADLAPHGDGDQLVVDHSQGGCMDLPRDQGNCGSCYAFAATTVFEWLYCKRHNQLVRFSEQYMVDCGKQYVPSNATNGCQGGRYFGAQQFLSSFGLELRINYPYRAKEQSCPYEPDTDIKSTGYVRFEADVMFSVPRSLWEEYLYFGPLLISIRTRDTDFHDYGRGVHDYKGCNLEAPGGHAMLLVGHGKDNGVEYWKVRNSHSIGWGEQGYWRVSKQSTKCVDDDGVALASKDAREYMLHKLKANPKHDRAVLKRHYWREQLAKKARSAPSAKRGRAREADSEEEERFFDASEQLDGNNSKRTKAAPEADAAAPWAANWPFSRFFGAR